MEKINFIINMLSKNLLLILLIVCFTMIIIGRLMRCLAKSRKFASILRKLHEKDIVDKYHELYNLILIKKFNLNNHPRTYKIIACEILSNYTRLNIKRQINLSDELIRLRNENLILDKSLYDLSLPTISILIPTMISFGVFVETSREDWIYRVICIVIYIVLILHAYLKVKNKNKILLSRVGFNDLCISQINLILDRDNKMKSK